MKKGCGIRMEDTEKNCSREDEGYREKLLWKEDGGYSEEGLWNKDGGYTEELF